MGCIPFCIHWSAGQFIYSEKGYIFLRGIFGGNKALAYKHLRIMKNVDKRESILRAANRLFEMQGFNGTGVDQIASESGVTKRTLYKHFGSKNGLIHEVLLDHHTHMMERVRETILSLPDDAAVRLLACFELYREWFGRSNFSGCIFIKTMNEFAGCSSKLGQVAQDAKRSMRTFLAEIAREGGAEQPDDLALKLQLLLEGSIVMAQSGSGPAIVDAALQVGTTLIEESLN